MADYQGLDEVISFETLSPTPRRGRRASLPAGAVIIIVIVIVIVVVIEIVINRATCVPSEEARSGIRVSPLPASSSQHLRAGFRHDLSVALQLPGCILQRLTVASAASDEALLCMLAPEANAPGPDVLYIYICIDICICVCMYIYIYIYMYISLYIYIYI